MVFLRRFVVSVLVLAILAAGALYLMSAHINRWVDPVLAHLESQAQVKIEIGDIRARFVEYRFRIVLDDVTMHPVTDLPDKDTADDMVFKFEHLSFDIDLWQSLVQQDVVLDSAYISGSHWDVITDEQGHIHVPTLGELYFHMPTLVMSDMVVTWVTPNGVDDISPLLVTLSISDELINFDVRLMADDDGGNDGKAALLQMNGVATEINMKEHNAWSMSVHVRGDDVRLDEWSERIPMPPVSDYEGGAGAHRGVASGIASMALDIEHIPGVDGDDLRVSGDVNVKDYVLHDMTYAMSANIKGRFLNEESIVEVSNASVSSDDFQWLEINASLHFDQSDVVSLSVDVPHIDEHYLEVDGSEILLTKAKLVMQGNTKVSSFSEGGELTYKDFQGRVDFDNARLAPVDFADRKITDLSGFIQLDNGELVAGNIRGRAEGSALSINIISADANDSTAQKTIIAEGTVALFEWLLKSNYVDRKSNSMTKNMAWLNKIKGASPWKVSVVIPEAKKDGWRWHIESNLEGASVNLPEPFKLAAEEQRYLSLGGSDKADEWFSVHYGKGADEDVLVARLKAQGDGVVGIVRLGKDVKLKPGASPNKKIMVRGNMGGVVDTTEWMNFYEAVAGDDAASFMPAVDIDVSFADVRFANYEIGETAIRMASDENGWFLNFDSEPAKGVMLKQTHIDVQMEHLSIKGVEDNGENKNNGENNDNNIGEDERADINLKLLPPFNIAIKDVRTNGWSVSMLTANVEPTEAGISISDLQFDAYDSEVSLNGMWSKDDAGKDNSRFLFEVTSDDFGKLLQDSFEQEGLGGGNGVVSGELAWAGAPWDFILSEAAGGMRVGIKEGQLRQAELGAGRLIGLFNIAAVVRRINLDFKDVFDEGLSFDTMSGSFEVKDGNVNVVGLEIDGLSTNIKMKGRAGLIARDYDQQLEVIIKLREGLPVIGALLGGPLAAVGVYLADQLTDITGMIDNAATLEYRITGTWDEPIVEFVQVKALDDVNKQFEGLGKFLEIDKSKKHETRPSIGQ